MAKYQLGVNSVVRKKATPKANLGNIPKKSESSFYSGEEKNYLGTGENYKTFGGSFDTKKGSFGAEAWVDKSNMSPSVYGTYSKEIKPNLNLDASVGINDKYFGLGLTKTFAKGVNLIAGGEKHRVYVKKSPTGVGKGVKGHVMVNHPTEDKGKWDTIDLTEKAGAKTVEDGKNATKKWHAENPYVSGAKSVKQYRGDENLPEAKNGMKKNCGCKHSKSKYKYQSGNKNITADDLEFERIMNPPSEFEGLPDVPYDFPLPKAKAKTVKVVSIKKDTTPVQKKTYPTVSGEKKIFIEKAPVNKIKNTPTDRVKEYFNNYYGGESVFPGTKKYQLVDGKMITSRKERFGKKDLGYDWENLSNTEKDKVTNMYKQKRRDDLQKQIDVMNASSKYRNSSLGGSGKLVAIQQKNREIKDIQDNVKKITSAVEGKSPYKYGTGALTIPEGSAIVTANGGKNKQAIAAYKQGNYKLLNNIIEDMPEDKTNGKNQIGNNSVDVMKNPLLVSDALKKNVKPGFYSDTVQTPAPGYTTKRAPSKQRQMELEYEKDPKSFEKKYGKTASSLQKERMQAVANKQETFKWSNNNKEYKSGFTIDKKEPAKSIVPMRPSTDTSNKTEAVENKQVDTNKEETFATNKKKGNFLSNIPSMAEIATRASILGQEGVPENYLKLGEYRYASQLPQTLREIQLSEQAGRETARDIVAGDAGRYLAQAGNLSSARMKAANEAVVQDTIARQDILNKNVDLRNVEAQTNRGLKDQYAALRGQARANYNEQLVGLGQRVDSATETSQEMSNQRNVDDIKLNLLKTGNYKMDSQGNIIFAGKNGAKKLKTYKRK